MIKKYIKFAWDVLNNEKGQFDPVKAIATIGGGLLGGMAGGQKGPPATTTQRIEQVRPVLTPEEQAMQNFFINQVYGRLGQTSPLQQLIESYYGGGYQPMTMGMTPGMQPAQISPEDVRQQYEQQVKADRWTGEVLPALQKISDIYAGSALGQMPIGSSMWGRATKLIGGEKELEGIAKQLGMTTDDVKKLYGEWQTSPETVAQRYTQPSGAAPTGQPSLTQSDLIKQFQQEHGRFPSQPELYQILEQNAAQMGQPGPAQAAGQLPAQPYSPLTAIMQQSPEQLGAQYDILRQQGMQGIQDWYQQAQREFERRGIGTYGGYMGTPMQQDLGGILAEQGRMQTELGRQLGLSELQARQQLPYGQLQALEDVRRYESQQQLAQQAPWIGVGQQMYALPWGQTTTTAQQQPGPGIIPGAISGAYTGAGLYGMGQNLGFWGSGGGGSLMTPGITNISATYGGSPSGFEGSMPGYAW